MVGFLFILFFILFIFIFIFVFIFILFLFIFYLFILVKVKPHQTLRLFFFFLSPTLLSCIRSIFTTISGLILLPVCYSCSRINGLTLIRIQASFQFDPGLSDSIHGLTPDFLPITSSTSSCFNNGHFSPPGLSIFPILH